MEWVIWSMGVEREYREKREKRKRRKREKRIITVNHSRQ
jgi:hypothetical protein